MKFKRVHYATFKPLKSLLMWALSLTLIYLIFGFEVVRIDSDSMQPTFKEGQSIILKRSFGFHNSYYRGQIVKFKTRSKSNVLKRIIGVPGDMIMVNKKDVFINKKSIGHFEILDREPVSHGQYKQDGYPLSVYETHVDDIQFEIALTGVVPEYKDNYFIQDNMPTGQWHVPEGHVFVLGDNRDFSYDGRYFGFVPYKSISAYYTP